MGIPIFNQGGRPVAVKPILRESIQSRDKGLKTRAKNRKLRKKRSR